MLSALFPCFRSITPGQGEAFSDQGLTRIPTACTNPGEGAPVAVLPVSIELHTLDPEQLSKPLLRLESCYQLGMTLDFLPFVKRLIRIEVLCRRLPRRAAC